jgi:hypothetical protein
MIEADPGLDRHVIAAIWMPMPAVIGEDAAVLIALPQSEQADFIHRLGDTLAEGSLPAPGSNGAAIHRDIAKARGLSIGSKFGQLVDPEDLTPGVFSVCGILDGPSRTGVIDLAYASTPTFILAQIPPLRIIYAKPGRKAESDRYLNEVKDAEGNLAFGVWDEAFWRRRIEKLLANLPLIVTPSSAPSPSSSHWSFSVEPDRVSGAERQFGLLLAWVARSRLVRNSCRELPDGAAPGSRSRARAGS